MDEDDDPDPGGWPVHPALAFYGMWPRFAAAEEAEAEVEDRLEAGVTE